jgi:hypothetical protein
MITVRVLVALVVMHDGAEVGVGVADGMIGGPTANRYRPRFAFFFAGFLAVFFFTADFDFLAVFFGRIFLAAFFTFLTADLATLLVATTALAIASTTFSGTVLSSSIGYPPN